MNKKLVTLLDLTLKRTRQGDLKWQDTLTDDSFETHLANSTLFIEKVKTGGYRFGIYDDAGRKLETLETATFVYVEGSVSGDLNLEQKAVELFEAARSQALQIDEKLDNLIKELG